MEPSTVGDEAASSPLGHRFMFVLLVLLAFCLYAPTAILPILKDHCELLQEETQLKETVGQLGHEIGNREALRQAFLEDSVINERLAMLDLQYHKPHEIVLPVLPVGHVPPKPPAADRPPPRSALMLPDDWPAWALKVEHWAGRRGLIDLFLDRTLRPIFLLMSAGLVIAAFVVFAPRRKRLPSVG